MNPFPPEDPHYEHWERVTPLPPPRPDPDEMSDRARAMGQRLLNSAALDTIQPPTPVVDGVLYADSLVWLQGRPGHGKSFVAIDIAGCLGLGENWQGHWVSGPYRVLYVVAEGASGLLHRVRAWESAMGQAMTRIAFLPEPVHGGGSDWDALIELCAHGQIQVIVLDTQARLTTGMEENSARDMGVWVAQLERLRATTRACVIVVHHQGRTGEHMRGSTAMEGAATTVIQVSKDEELVTVRCLKQKDAAPFDDIQLRLVPHADSAILALTDGRQVGSMTAQARKWLTSWSDLHGDEYVSISVLVKSGVVTEPTFHRSKKLLIEERALERKGQGPGVRYRLLWSPELGLSHSHPIGGESE